MKILWVSNFPLPQISEKMGSKAVVNEGWKIYLCELLSTRKDIELCIAFPFVGIEQIVSGTVDSYKYYAFPVDNLVEASNNASQFISNIIDESCPDVIHFWGTEFPHSLMFLNECLKKSIIDKCVVSIQGLAFLCAYHYEEGIPQRVCKRISIYEKLRKTSVNDQKKMMEMRGKYELEFLSKIKNAIGRTEFDNAVLKLVNNNITYYKCDELLRKEFYSDNWNINSCEKHSIFVTQAGYPLKGLHFIIEIFNIVSKYYPDSKLYIGGRNSISLNKKQILKDLLKKETYFEYIKKMINKYGLKDRIVFLNMLDAKNMKLRLLNSNVVLSASILENSSNSICEAMLLGVPVVASDVGGTKSIIEHNIQGYLYQYDAPYMAAHYIMKVFDDSNIAESFSNAERNRAACVHDPEKIENDMLEIYKKIAGVENE